MIGIIYSGYEELFNQRRRERQDKEEKKGREEKVKKEEEEEEMVEVKDDSPHDEDMTGSPQRKDGVLHTGEIDSPPVVLADNDSHADVVVDGTTGPESVRMVDAKDQKKNRKMDKKIKQELIAGFTRTIILVRHGAYFKGREREVDRKLTTDGVKEVENAADKILTLHKKLVNDGREIEVVYSSNLTRSIETANIIAEKLNQSEKVVCQEDKNLEEALEPPFPYLPYDGEWKTTLNSQADSMQVARQRLDTAFDKYFKRAACDDDIKTVVLACHANVIRYLVCKALQFPMEGWQRLKCDNGSLTVIKIYPDGAVKLALLNDISQGTDAPVISTSRDTLDDSLDTLDDNVDTPSTSATIATLDTVN